MSPEINRTGFRQAIETAIDECAEGRYFAVVVIKLHDLHKINGIHGYDRADTILGAAFESLNESMKRASIVCRLSSTSFGLIVTDLKFPQLIQVGLERALDAVGGPFLLDDKEIFLKTTAGTSLYPPNGDSADQLFIRAETALLLNGPTDQRISLYEKHQQKSDVDQWLLETDLKSAVVEQQLQVHYQPQVRLEDNSTSGFEALLRWHHPVHGSVPPHLFVPIAESGGMINDITEWILQTALRETTRTEKEGEHTTISVNVSPLTLFDPSFPSAIDSAVSLWGASYEQLIIEITEGVFIEDFKASKTLLNELRSKGVRISIDDFGTGYSSLSYFKQLPVDELKIDRSFVTNIVDSAEDQKLVSVILELAHKFGLSTVAEGIEDQAMFRTLRELGCDIGQGYYFSKALEPAHLRAWSDGNILTSDNGIGNP